jgi:hypothetical protein
MIVPPVSVIWLFFFYWGHASISASDSRNRTGHLFVVALSQRLGPHFLENVGFDS